MIVHALITILLITMISYDSLWSDDKYYRVATLPGKLECLSFTFSGLENAWKFAQKVGKTWNCNSKPGKNWKLYIWCFKFHFSWCHLENKNWFTYLSYLQNQHKLWFKAKLIREFNFYLEITWKIHGILSQQRSGNPVWLWMMKICRLLGTFSVDQQLYLWIIMGGADNESLV